MELTNWNIPVLALRGLTVFQWKSAEWTMLLK